MIPSNELHRVPRKKHKDPHAPTSGYETSDTVLSDGDRDRYVIHGAANNSIHRGSSRGAQSDNELTTRDLAVIAAQRQRHALQHQMHQQQQDLSPALQVPRPSRPHRHSSGLSGSFSALALSQEDPAQRKPIMGPPRHSMFEMNHEDALNKEKMSRTQQRLQHSRELPMLPVLNQSSHSLAHGPTSAEQVLNLPLNSSSSRAVHIGQHSGGSSFNYSAGATQQPVSISSRHNRKMSSVSMSEDETLSRASSDPLSPMGPPEMAGRRPSGGTVSNNMPRVAVRNLPPLTNQQLSATSPRQFLPNNSGSVVYSPVPPFSPYSQSFERDRSEVSSPLPPADPTFARPLPLARQHSNSRVHYSTEPENDFSDRSDVCGNPNCHCTPSPRPHHSHMQNASPQFPHPPPPSQYSHHPRAPITPQHHPQHFQSPPPPYPPQQQYGQGILIGIDTPPPLPARQMQSGVRQRSGSVVSAGAGEMPQAPLSPQPVDPPPNPSESMGMSTTDWMQLLKNYRTKAGAETAPAPATTAAS